VLQSVDTFSCLGSHATGLERAGIGTLEFCEINPYRRSVLQRLFPGKPVHDDIHTFSPRHRGGILIGGPPCKKTSAASAIHGKRTGATLWPQQLRVGLDMEAEWIVVEQPPGHAAWEAKVGDDLSGAGYHVARVEFAACDVGAPYLRRRVFLVACPSLTRLEIAWRAVPSAIERTKRAADARGDWNPDQLGTLRVDARSAGEFNSALSAARVERIKALGDSNPPHMAEVIGRAIVAAET
jgi:DNA (cytosine-5)-methyltransferase 1